MYLISDFCTPAQIHLLIAFCAMLYLIIKNRNSILLLIIKSIAFIGWTFVLSYICKLGYKAVAWILAVVPNIIFLFVTMLA